MASVLIIGPHPDDQELGMGGTLALLAAQGHRVTILDLTNGEPTPKGSPEIRAREAADAAATLSPPDNPITRITLDLPNRSVTHDIPSRHKVAGVIRAVQAEVVFAPYFEDAHPDHLAGTRIIEDARFDAKLSKVSMPGDRGMPPIHPRRLIYFFATHLRIVPQPSFIIDISTTLELKHRAIACYASQLGPTTANATLGERILAQDHYFGSRINTKAGEPFFVREPLGLRGFDGVI
ncbi:MAG: PIG-L family deacetylase [Phycisphaerales bacterium]|nr:PIG-L family deacetylase [Phycisphaerales bacterium]